MCWVEFPWPYVQRNARRQHVLPGSAWCRSFQGEDEWTALADRGRGQSSEWQSALAIRQKRSYSHVGSVSNEPDVCVCKHHGTRGKGRPPSVESEMRQVPDSHLKLSGFVVGLTVVPSTAQSQGTYVSASSSVTNRGCDDAVQGIRHHDSGQHRLTRRMYLRQEKWRWRNLKSR